MSGNIAAVRQVTGVAEPIQRRLEVACCGHFHLCMTSDRAWVRTYAKWLDVRGNRFHSPINQT